MHRAEALDSAHEELPYKRHVVFGRGFQQQELRGENFRRKKDSRYAKQSRLPKRWRQAVDTQISMYPEVPIIEALKQHKALKTVPFHIPGHKQGNGMLPELLQVIGDSVACLDLTELPGHSQ